MFMNIDAVVTSVMMSEVERDKRIQGIPCEHFPAFVARQTWVDVWSRKLRGACVCGNKYFVSAGRNGRFKETAARATGRVTHLGQVLDEDDTWQGLNHDPVLRWVERFGCD